METSAGRSGLGTVALAQHEKDSCSSDRSSWVALSKPLTYPVVSCLAKLGC